MDMDTPDEYERLLAAITDYEVPSASECMVLLTEKFQVPEPIVAHASTVGQVALRLARALTKRGLTLNLKLIVAAALLHDLAKGKPDHASVAAAALRDLGYPAVADIVAVHMDPQPQSGVPISAQEVVCFADKVVEAETIMSVEKRFGKKIEDCGENPVLAHVLKQRLSNILRLQERLEAALGSPIEQALPTSFADCGED